MRLDRSIVTALAALLVSGAAWAADTPANPHGAFQEDCALCHRADGWKPAVISPRFDHGKYGFKLTGGHADLVCASCHRTLDFKQADTRCAACHQDVHRGQFGNDCQRCHTTTNFIEHAEQLRLHRFFRFPLTGSHLGLDCVSCHKPVSTGQTDFSGTTDRCVGCHRQDFLGAKNPDHAANGFPEDCEQCHSTLSWSQAKFDHARTGFPLTGAHRSLVCSDCHIDNKFKGTPASCVSCHQQDYNNTVDPNHVQGSFPTTCQECHSTNSWRPAKFDHNKTNFPLTGAHKPLDCAACHGDGVYHGKPTDCYSCHKSDYDSTNNPHHGPAGFSTDCTQCHTTSSWDGAKFDHDKTNFPLTGAHKQLACSACHSDAVYRGKPTDCYSCHKSDYDGTTNPNHQAAHFPTDCKQCHSTSSWDGAKFDHDGKWFPIYSGTHRNRWSSCSDCHINPNDFMVFSCLTCHPHSDRAETDGHHRDVRGYSYDSNACYRCHPNGRAGD